MWLWSPSSRSFSVQGFDGALNVDITEFLDGHGLENPGISSEKMAISMEIMDALYSLFHRNPPWKWMISILGHLQRVISTGIQWWFHGLHQKNLMIMGFTL